MAYLFPNSPAGSLPPEVLKVFKFLKTLPDDFVIWHHLAFWQKEAPEFLVVNPKRQALLVKVSNAPTSAATPAAQLVLISNEIRPLGEDEARILNNFLQILCPNQTGQDFPINTLVVFTNIPDKQAAAARLRRLPGEPYWAGKEAIQSDAVELWLRLMVGPSLNSLQLEKLRQAFTPEIVVPVEFTVRAPIQRRLDAGLTDYLLDYNQEAAVKTDLDLPSESDGITSDLRLNIINGVAGSGKTLILLFRLRLLYELYPQKKYLVLTHNRPLIRDMQARFTRLASPNKSAIHWYTFNAWCKRQWPESMKWLDPLSYNHRKNIIHEAWLKTLKDTRITEEMLSSEVDWLKDQVTSEKLAYLESERRGRGFRLSQEQRELMYNGILAYQRLISEHNLTDWSDIPRKIWKMIHDGVLQPPRYDVILIDEAQFFAPIWFDIIRKIIQPKTGHLFVVADPTQGFLRRGSSWKSLGLDARGHSQQLRRSYRSTQEILDFATLFYRLRIPNEKEEDILTPDLLHMPTGAVPTIIPLTSPQDEIARAANEAVELVNKGMRKCDLLILHANWSGAEMLIQTINRKLGGESAADPKDKAPGDYIRITTLNAGTGLESPIVFLIGLHELFEHEQSLRLSDDEREALIIENTRKIYMAATRAGQRLVFTYVGELPEILSQCFSP